MPRTHTPETRSRAVERYIAGSETAAEIGRDLGVKGDSVARWVAEAGHPVRRRPSKDAEIRLTGGAWVRDGLVWRYEVAA